jgi:Ca2+-binding RTX toxin-like protein
MAGNDEVHAGGGTDRVEGGLGNDILDGGAGSDTIVYANGAAVTLSLAIAGPQDTIGAGIDTLTGFENILGSGFADTLTGDGGNNVIDGWGGDDHMTGGLGDDTYVVDSFGDVVTENAGEGLDTVFTSVGSSTDFTQLYYLPDNVENLTGISSTGQGVWGNALDNVIAMGSGKDLIVLADRTDYFSTAGGSDTVDAGGGNDFIFFGGGFDASDKVDGGTGFDAVGLLGTYDLTLGAQNLVNVEKFVMYSSGDAANPNGYTITTVDQNVASGQQLLVVAASLQAGEHLVFNGSAETDGSYTVMGGHDVDTITGGHGADRFIAGGGADLLTGGAGNDVFQYNAVSDSTAAATDTITDFSAGDKIDLWFVDADGNAANGDQRFSFIGTNAFSHNAGELRAVEDGANPGHWFIQGDTNGDGVADLVIDVTVTDGHAIAATDFLL